MNIIVSLKKVLKASLCQLLAKKHYNSYPDKIEIILFYHSDDKL